MRNPIDVFFGTDVVSQLRRQPSALRRVAERVKPLLMAAVHPDKGLEVHSGVAAEISEAYAVLSKATPDEIERMVETFLSENSRRTNQLKIELRSKRLEADNQRLIIDSLRGEVSRLEKKNQMIQHAQKSADSVTWAWIVASLGDDLPALREATKRIRRSMLHHYRIIVQYGVEFKAFEFDITGKIRMSVTTSDIEMARTAFLSGGDDDRTFARVDFRHDNEYFLGVSTEDPKDVVHSLQVGNIVPFVQVGGFAVFVPWVSESEPFRIMRSELSGGKVLEIISIRRMRKSVARHGSSPQSTQLRRKIIVQKRSLRKKMEEEKKSRKREEKKK